jgi:Mycothiol maleylpyruvate isomerase N-terminal domain
MDGTSLSGNLSRTASTDLGKALASASPVNPAWTWSDDKTVGFIIRRQAHEALIHRIDAELTVGQRRSVMDRQLSADGVDEALRVMYGGGLPVWGTFAPDARHTVRVRASDTSDSWFVTLGRFSGADPDDSKSYDQEGIQVARVDPGGPSAASCLRRADRQRHQLEPAEQLSRLPCQVVMHASRAAVVEHHLRRWC